MKRVFYSEDELALGKKKCKQSLFCCAIFFSLAVIAFALSILLATFERKIMWMVLGCFLSIVPFSLSFLFFFQYRRRSESVCMYKQILNEEGETYKGAVTAIKEHPITLSNSFEVYEVEVTLDPQNMKIFYLSSDKIKGCGIEIGNYYSFRIVSLYIKEIEHA